MNKTIFPLFFAALLPFTVNADELTVEADLTVEGDTTLEQSLHVQGDNGILFEGSLGQGTIPAQGPGIRMMWYPRKAAFRVGRVLGSNWDDSNIGSYSAAIGVNTLASGPFSTAWGRESTADGLYSTAWGFSSFAGGSRSTAWGADNFALGIDSTAWGFANHSIGDSSTTWGYQNWAYGDYSTAWGYENSPSGIKSTAWGESNLASALLSTALGRLNVGGGTSDAWNDIDPLFEIGNGTWAPTVRSNALTVLKNGRTTLENKFWDDQDPTAIPTDPGASDGEALVVNGHARFAGRVQIEPQGDIPMFGQ